MSVTLFNRNIKQIAKPLLIFLAVLGMYQGVIIYMYDPKLMEMLTQYQKLMPEMMAAVGMTGVTDTLLKFMNTYLYGFLMQLFPFIFLMVIGNSMIMKYVDTGSMAILLSTPNSRKKIIVTQAITMVLTTVVFMFVLTLMGIGFAEIMFSGELDIPVFIKLNISTLLVQLMISGIVFCAASVFNESKHYYGVVCGIVLGSYLMSMLSNMGDKLENFKYFSLFSLLPATKIVEQENGIMVYSVSLVVMTAILYTVGIVYFNKKDLSL